MHVVTYNDDNTLTQYVCLYVCTLYNVHVTERKKS